MLTTYKGWDITQGMSIESALPVTLHCTQCENNTSIIFDLCLDDKIDREQYLWLLHYFQRYDQKSIWGKWIQIQLEMRVVYG